MHLTEENILESNGFSTALHSRFQIAWYRPANLDQLAFASSPPEIS